MSLCFVQVMVLILIMTRNLNLICWIISPKVVLFWCYILYIKSSHSAFFFLQNTLLISLCLYRHSSAAGFEKQWQTKCKENTTSKQSSGFCIHWEARRWFRKAMEVVALSRQIVEGYQFLVAYSKLPTVRIMPSACFAFVGFMFQLALFHPLFFLCLNYSMFFMHFWAEYYICCAG